MKINKTQFLILLFVFTSFLSAMGQIKESYILFLSDQDRAGFNNDKALNSFPDIVKNEKDLREWMYLIYDQGYLLAYYELIPNDSFQVHVNLFLGQRFTWARLSQGNLSDDVLIKSGFKQGFFSQRFVNFKRISNLFRAVITYSENNGYPFAQVRLAGLEILDQELSAEIDFDPGPFITFDSLVLINKNKVKTAFLAAFLNVKPNSTYDQRKVNRIPSLIDPLPYLSINTVPELHFANEQCEILLDLTDERASAFDGIIGFLPNQSEEGKLLITGQVYLKIENLFRSGKRLELDWKKIDVQTQELGINYNHPAIFRLPLDFGISFDLYKQDTSFLTRNFNFNFLYNNYKGGQLGVNYQNISSRLLGTPEIPDSVNLLIADYNLNYYGLLYSYNSLDHPIFPSMGWKIEINGDIGYKNVIENSAIDSEYYANIPPKSLQWQSTLSTDKYFSLAPRNVLVAKLSAGYMQNDQLFLNDLFRLGGINSIRGFNEKFFYASKYIIGTLEYHYLFENESQLIAFFDGASLGFDINDQTYRDQPFGLGAGISLSTGAGLLNVIFAMGKSNKQPFGFKYSKIHVGYTNRF